LGQPAQEITNWLRPVADKYGMILLATSDYRPEVLGTTLRVILRRFAIDPAKIAIIGRCGSGGAGMRLGLDNPDVFSRIAMISGDGPPDGPKRPGVEALMDGGVLEADAVLRATVGWRQAGYPVTAELGLRGHEHQVEDYDYLGRWLHESWATPASTPRTSPQVVADPLPVLTTEMLVKMTAFWTRFAQEPVAIRDTVRREHLRPVVLPMGQAHPLMVLTDMAALAAQAPSVAADLQAAGLTAQQHDAYRVAIITAYVAAFLQREPQGPHGYNGAMGAISATSVLGQNIAFVNGHPAELKALARAGMTHPEKLEDPALGGHAPPLPPGAPAWLQKYAASGMHTSYPRRSPAIIPQYGFMGFWRTP
jgi:hypothetical protein